MPLESASYPTQLISTYPLSSDLEGQGDDHIRLIKRVIQATFPNFGSTLWATQSQLNRLSDASHALSPGMILIWGGPIGSIPAGWKLCNGAGVTSNGIQIPDLRDRMVVASGGSYSVGSTGGSLNHGHTSTVTVANHTLTVSQLPPHNHEQSFYTGYGQASQAGFGERMIPDATLTPIGNTEETGGGQPHNHSATITIGNSSNLPPCYALAYIIKD